MIRSKLLGNFPPISWYHVCKRNHESQPENLPKRSLAGSIASTPGMAGYLRFIQNLQQITLENLTFENFRRKKKEYEYKALLHDQRYIFERHSILGANLACAHFVVYRGGTVKFHGDDFWIKKSPKEWTVPLPTKFVPNYYLEAVDFSNSDLLYEGLENFRDLYQLKALNISNCKYIDDWCLDRMHQFQSLEHLDISGCPLITERGIATLEKLRNLKTVNLADLPKASHIELVSIMLEDAIPNCKVYGVNYMDLAPKYLSAS